MPGRKNPAPGQRLKLSAGFSNIEAIADLGESNFSIVMEIEKDLQVNKTTL